MRLVGRPVEQGPRAHSESAGECFEEMDVNAVERDAAQHPHGSGARDAGLGGEAVRGAPALADHVGLKVPTDHGVSVALLFPLDK